MDNKFLYGYGAIFGDIIGQPHEFPQANRLKTKDFRLFWEDAHFTDDTAMSIAVMDWLVNGGDVKDYYLKWGEKYKTLGYGPSFRKWLFEDQEHKPFNSCGNGSGMRGWPVGYAVKTMEECLKKAEESALPTHNHPEGIKGAQAIAACVFLAYNSYTKKDIKEFVETNFGYDLNRTVDSIRPDYKFEVLCQTSIPESIICFLESTSYEDAIRNAISLGGDSDTQACMTGAIAEAFYKGVNDDAILKSGCIFLDNDVKSVVENFNNHFNL